MTNEESISLYDRNFNQIERKMQEDPILLFKTWLSEAEKTELNAPNAMTLATADSSGAVTARIVLLKDTWDGRFVFYTNLESQKSHQIRENNNVSLCFHWKTLQKQIRVDGEALQVPDKVADAYFSQRPRESQLGAWASKQSQPLVHREELEDRIDYFQQKFKNQSIPRPSFWSGFAVTPHRIEFWTEKPFRLHERCVYIKQNSNTWTITQLYP